jgi:glycosyltransferase involved in cell wall biosynthesis
VDDGSTDNTELIVSGFSDERIRFYKAGRIGINGKIKNIGLSKANGDLIAFIDHDDLWAQDKLEKQLMALQEYPDAGFCLTGGYNFKKPGEPFEYFYKTRDGIRYDNVFFSFFNSELAGFTQALMLRKESIATIGVFKEDNSFSDVEFILSLAKRFKAVILYEPLLFRRLHDANYSNEQQINWHYKGIAMIKSYRALLPPKIFAESLYMSYINLGEKYLQQKKNAKAMLQFFNAWSRKPFSIIPLKKTAKAVLSGLKK